MKEIRTVDAVGQILCHDITQIIKDQKKGVLFKKGHVVREEDIPASSFGRKRASFRVGEEERGCCTKTRRPRFSIRSQQESICTEVRSKRVRLS